MTGIGHPLPSTCVPGMALIIGDNTGETILEGCSDEFIDIYNKSDIIISKGQGNYETNNRTSKEILWQDRQNGEKLSIYQQYLILYHLNQMSLNYRKTILDGSRMGRLRLLIYRYATWNR